MHVFEEKVLLIKANIGVLQKIVTKNLVLSLLTEIFYRFQQSQIGDFMKLVILLYIIKLVKFQWAEYLMLKLKIKTN